MGIWDRKKVKLASRKTFVATLLMTLFAASAGAQVIGKTMLAGSLPACNSTRNFGLVVDATNATTLGAGGGNAAVWVVCDSSGVWTIDEVAAVSDLSAYLPVSGTTAAPIVIQNSGAGNDGSFIVIDDLILTGTDLLPTFSATMVLTAPVSSIVASTSMTTTSPIQVATASTSMLATTPKYSISGVYERKVTDVTVADDAAGTKPAGVTPITTDYVTCTCNDATGCTMSVAEPTVTSGYGRSLTIVSSGTGNCEYADSAGVTEIGAAVVLEPTSVLNLVYANAAWHRLSTADNVP
jgi:hypothetical protein